MRKTFACAMLVASVLGSRAVAGDCQLASSSCVDQTTSKTISGVPVTLAEVGGCWEYQDTYTCLKPEAIDYCSALAAAGCGQTASTCSDTAFNESCNSYTKTFQCGIDPGTPSNTIRLSNSYTLTTDSADTGACSSHAQNARCRLAAHTCVDSTPCKLDDSGARVCLAGVTPPTGGLNSTAACWRYQDDYSCIADNPLDYCAAIQATEGCVRIGSICDGAAFDGSCNQYTRTYQCTNTTASTSPPTVVALDTSYTIASNTLDISGCTSLAQSSNCVHAAHTCTDHTPCKTINGLQVCLNTVSPLPEGAQSSGDSCWAWSEDYTCAATTLSNDCQDLVDRGCTQVGSECLDRAASNACEMSERSYSCQTSPATATQRTVCDQRSFCAGGTACFDTSHPADEDFGRVMATLEAAREAGVYGADQQLFQGVAEQCRKKLFGLVNCCKKGGGGAAKSNHTLMSAATQGVSAGGQLAVNAGSKYLFDFMYPEYAGYIEAGTQAMISSEVLFTPTNFQPSFSFYGLTLSTGTMSTGLLGGPIYSLGSVGPFNLHNDVSDFELGNDTPDRLGPPRVTAMAWLSASAVRRGAWIAFALAFNFGIYLAWHGGWPIIVIGLASLFAGWAYTGGPRPIAYTPLGELFVLLFFGLAAVGGSYYLQTMSINPSTLLAGVIVGLFGAAVITVNNARDLDTDAHVGRRTLALVLGRRRARWVYSAEILLPFALLPCLAQLAERGVWLAMPLLVLPLALRQVDRFRCAESGPAFNELLAHTAR